MHFDRFVPRFAKHELRHSQMFSKLVITLSLIRIREESD